MTTTHSSPHSNWAPSFCPLHSRTQGWPGPSWPWSVLLYPDLTIVSSRLMTSAVGQWRGDLVTRGQHEGDQETGERPEWQDTSTSGQQGGEMYLWDLYLRVSLCGMWPVRLQIGVTPGAQCTGCWGPTCWLSLMSKAGGTTDPGPAATDGPWATTGSRSVWQLNDIMTSPLLDKSIISIASSSYFVFLIFFLFATIRNETQSRKFHLNSFACMLNINARNTSLDYYSWVLISKGTPKINFPLTFQVCRKWSVSVCPWSLTSLSPSPRHPRLMSGWLTSHTPGSLLSTPQPTSVTSRGSILIS